MNNRFPDIFSGPSKGCAAALLLFLFFALPAQGGERNFQPRGPESVVHSYTAYNQRIPEISCDYAGNFIIAWTNGDVWARRFYKDGTPMGEAFQANTLTDYTQNDVAVCWSCSGSFVVAWSDWNGYDGSAMGVFARLYDVDGQPAGPEFVVPTATEGSQFEPHISMDWEGNFVITWSDSHAADAFGRCFDKTGNPLGDQFLINEFVSGYQLYPTVAVHRDGTFFVSAFVDAAGQDGDKRGIFARLFDSQGLPLAGPFQVNNLHTQESQVFPYVAMNGPGAFVITWEDNGGADGDGEGIFARMFGADGTAAGDEFQVNEVTAGSQCCPEIAADYVGNFIITWTDYSTGDGEIKARRFDAWGAPLGEEFSVNSISLGTQAWPSVAMDRAGEEIVFAFEGLGDETDVYARQYVFHPILVSGIPMAGSPPQGNLPPSTPPPAGSHYNPSPGNSVVDIELFFPGAAGLSYQLYLSRSDFPGQFLPDGRLLFLNNDDVFRFFLLHPGEGLLNNFQGILDGEARAWASITLPDDPRWSRFRLYLAGTAWVEGIPLAAGLRTVTDPVEITLNR